MRRRGGQRPRHLAGRGNDGGGEQSQREAAPRPDGTTGAPSTPPTPGGRRPEGTSDARSAPATGRGDEPVRTGGEPSPPSGWPGHRPDSTDAGASAPPGWWGPRPERNDVPGVPPTRHGLGRDGAGMLGAAMPGNTDAATHGDADHGGDAGHDDAWGPRSSWRRWALPVALGAIAVGAGAAALALAGEPAAEAVGVDQVAATPVLSARRAPGLIAAPVADRRLEADLQEWLAASPTDSCLVVDEQGREAFAHNPTAALTGASTQKLLTATGLLLALGPDTTFRTDAVAAAPPDGGVIDGDLFLVGGGPADLGTTDWPEMSPGTRPRVVHDIDALVDALAAAGVTRVEGSIVGDGSRYDDELYQPTLPQRFVDQDQVGPVDALMVNDGFAAFSPARDNAGTVPATVPAADAARVLTERLEARGIAVAGAPRSGTAPADAAAVATLESPPVSQLVAEMLTTSDNEAAEASLKELGVAEAGAGTWDAGAAALPGLLAEAGVPVEGVQVADGSGLSIENGLTCQVLVDVLSLTETGPVVRAGLAVAGESGTLAERWRGTDVAGRLRAKTGTLRNVTALAGEITPLQGGSLTFAYVANVPDPGEVSPGEVGLDRLAEILVAYPRGVDEAALAPFPPTAAG